MKQVHVECLPDEALIKMLGFTRKSVTHHSGKSRVFSRLKLVSNQLAMVDEDTGSAKTEYERKLVLVNEVQGIKLYSDKSGNKIIVLKGKLEDWVIAICKRAEIKLSEFGLPEKPNDLHSVINQRINKLEKLIEYLLKNRNTEVTQLKDWLS
jgi:hypothetical protein